MPDEIIQVQVTREETPEETPRGTGGAGGVLGATFLALVIGLLVWWIPFLWVLLIAAGVLAILSTVKLARRRALWEERFGRPAEAVTVCTFVRLVGAWFFGIMAIAPFIILLVVAAGVGIAILVVIAILALVASLFSIE